MTAKPQDQGDRLLWMLGGSVAVVALVSIGLVFWPAGDAEEPTARAPAAVAVIDVETPSAVVAVANDDADIVARLNRAQLALDAGMLLEPEGFSAWSLYAGIIEARPGHPAAVAGLEAVTSALVDRARLAVGEGRDDEADALTEHVLELFPDRADALAIRDRPRVAPPVRAPQPSIPSRQPAITPPRPAVSIAPPTREPTITLTIARNDRVVELYPSFTRALAAGTLIAPPEESAEHFIEAMRAIDPVHAMTRDAEQQLFDAAFARHAAAFDALDTEAALEWLAAADRMSVDSTRVAAARKAVVDFLTERAAKALISASELTITNYVSPSYPASAERRGVEGWVDVEFVVGVDGTPREVMAVDSSHSMFEQEALEAVGQWRFEPHRITGRIVEQRAQTRIRFVFE